MNARAEIYIFTNIKVRDTAQRGSTVSVLSKIGTTKNSENTETGRFSSGDIQLLEGKAAELEGFQLKILKQSAVHRAIYNFESLPTLIKLVYLFSIGLKRIPIFSNPNPFKSLARIRIRIRVHTVFFCTILS